MTITSKQAKRLQVKDRSQISPHLEKCCLLVSANESYAKTVENVKQLTGMEISHSSQQRYVQRHDFPEVVVSETVEEASLDGGKVRIRTAKGLKSEWKDYKAVTLHGQAVAAYFLDNLALINWVHQQPLAEIVSCLGDGHDGIWSLFKQMLPSEQRFELLDWYHLKEHLYAVGGSLRRLEKAEKLLWEGDVEKVISLFGDCKFKFKRATNFVDYISKHRTRIPEYGYLLQLGLTIGSGSVESSIKQIGRRIKISGAQWKKENVAQVLKHRCSYLNGYLYSHEYLYSEAS